MAGFMSRTASTHAPSTLTSDTASSMDLYHDVEGSCSPSNPTPISSVASLNKNIVFLKPPFSENALGFEVIVPPKIFSTASQLRAEFLQTLQSPVEQGSVNEVSCSLHFLASFVEFTARVVQERELDRELTLEVLRAAVQLMDDEHFKGNDVHVVVRGLSAPSSDKSDIVRAFVLAKNLLGQIYGNGTSYLLQAGLRGTSTVYAVFGGQGNDENYFSELRYLYSVYRPMVHNLVQSAAILLRRLSQRDRFTGCYPESMELFDWLEGSSEEVPSTSYLISAPVSFPLITLLQLMHYKITCAHLGCGPAEMHKFWAGATGHSQGILSAVVVAAADSWVSFNNLALQALAVSFAIGCCSQQAFGRPELTQAVLADCYKAEAQVPTSMLSIRGLSREKVEAIVKEMNDRLPKADVSIEVSLTNEGNSFVVTGPPMSLRGLYRLLSSRFPSRDQSKIPSRRRIPEVVKHFLPVTAPFHNSSLSLATSAAIQECKDIELLGSGLSIPVFSTIDGSDLRARQDSNIIPDLIRMVTCQPVDWPAAVRLPSATHILDFGPGGASGVGTFINKIKYGSGVHVIMATVMDGSSPDYGYKPDVFDNPEKARSHMQNMLPWADAYKPRLMRVAGDKDRVIVDTRFSRLMALPPVMVAAMTPTTSSWEFVAATMNAGYHVELACGGFHDGTSLTDAVKSVLAHTSPGRGLTCNLIYASPKTLRWQIAELQRLVDAGARIDGLTIGAGVPSLEIARGYVDTLRLRHIAFKPGSTEAIHRVLEIAKAVAPVHVILQWTGGRGGGHHSAEDIHTPLAHMYGRIRAAENVVLVVGSGFGGSEDTMPYITGRWAVERGLQSMPVDGVLLGSRMMVAKEAKTSPLVKAAIVDACGVTDSQWEDTFDRPTGGVISVISEMGEPIHKLATRGVQLWHELDRTIFRLDKAKRLAEIEKLRDSIIERLNADFQKVWFGRDGLTGKPAEVDDMTYLEVLERFVELTYITSERRWVHSSWQNIHFDFSTRVVARLSSDVTPAMNLFHGPADFRDPHSALGKLRKELPEAATQLVSYEDAKYFVFLCRRPGQKPVPFVPVLDADFETWFKKDSLWQSEDLQAVPDQDVGRVCVLQGPVAVRYSTVVDEPVKEILDGIHDGWVAGLLASDYNGESSGIMAADCSDIDLTDEDSGAQDYNTVFGNISDGGWLSISRSEVAITPERWTNLLAGTQNDWKKALFGSTRIIRGQKVIMNPVHNLLRGLTGNDLRIVENDLVPSLEFFEIGENSDCTKIMECTLVERGKSIILELFHGQSASGEPTTLRIEFAYDRCFPITPIREIDTGRNARIKDFYHRIWFGKPLQSGTSIYDEFECGPYCVVKSSVACFSDCINRSAKSTIGTRNDCHVPMDFAIVAAWKSVVGPLFAREIDADLTKLVHLSNEFRILPGHPPIRLEDYLYAKTYVSAVINQSAGKMIEVSGKIFRGGEPVMEISTKFLLRGSFVDDEHTFRRSAITSRKLTLKSPKVVAVLTAEPWFQLLDPAYNLLNKTLDFTLESRVRIRHDGTFRNIHVEGSASAAGKKIATCSYLASNTSGRDPVISFLDELGSPANDIIRLKEPVALFPGEKILLKAPSRSESADYACASGDFNPIHVSAMFALHANLPQTIVHGMQTGALTRDIAQRLLCSERPDAFKRFRASFTGKVFEADTLEVSFRHVAMCQGRKIVEIEVLDQDTQEKVLRGECEIEPAPMAYLFAGQGSQKQGMGMALYEESAVARQVWDFADEYFVRQYGFRITDIIRTNPRTLTVRFSGEAGRRVRANYMALTLENIAGSDTVMQTKLFPTIGEDTESYTYRSDTGLLSSTQFTQPALVLMERAILADLQARQLVSEESMYAGHSLGEYSALIALGDIMTLENALFTVFYRGLVMQSTVERDTRGRSKFGMCAVDPSRVSKNFDGASLSSVVAAIVSKTRWLLEVVNYNIADLQYVCAGEVRALHCLGSVLDRLYAAGISPSSAPDGQDLLYFVSTCIEQANLLPKTVELVRSKATIPLSGLDVPFHSSYLQLGVDTFRKCLQRSILRDRIEPPKLVGRYIPNLTARPFELTREYFEDVASLTDSVPIRRVLDMWDQLQEGMESTEDAWELIRQLRNSCRA